MLVLSLTTLRDRWLLFVGAAVTVCIGVALVQASLLTLVAAATADVPAGLSPTDELLVSNAFTTAVVLMGMVVGIAAFVAIFIVGSTFAFTVAQRRRDFALMRLVGASNRPVRRLLLGESLVLGMVGSGGGVLLGIWLARYERHTLIDLGFVPDEFVVGWRWWILAVSIGVGVGVSALGSFAAARRAGRVPPLAALRRTDAADKVMTLSRWLIGLAAITGAAAMLIAAGSVSGEDALGISISMCLVLVVGLSALSPIVVPFVGAVVGAASVVLAPRSRLGPVIRANVRDGVRRNASTAAPIIVLMGLVVGLIGGADILSAGSRTETMLTMNGDLVVDSAVPIDDELSTHPGVSGFSREAPVVVGIDDDLEDGSARLASYVAVAIDPATYPTTHHLGVIEGDLTALTGTETVVLSEYLMSRRHIELGQRAPLRINGIDHDLQVVAVLPNTLAGPDVLLPFDLAIADEFDHRYIVQLDTPQDAPAVAASLARNDSVEVTAMSEWIRETSDAEERLNRNIMIAIVGLAAIYTTIAMANAAAIAASERREEFAILRLTGLTRPQVIRTAVWESMTVVLVGTLLGGLAAAGTVIGTSAAVSELVGTRISATPWALAGALVALTVIVVGATTLLTTIAATRESPIAVAGARD